MTPLPELEDRPPWWSLALAAACAGLVLACQVVAAPAPKGETWAGGLECENGHLALAVPLGPAVVRADGAKQVVEHQRYVLIYPDAAGEAKAWAVWEGKPAGVTVTGRVVGHRGGWPVILVERMVARD